MTITIVNTHDVIGGAERCSYDLARGLHREGEDVTLLVGRKLGNDPFVEQLSYHPIDWKLRSFTHGKMGLTDTTIVAPLVACWTRSALAKADIYHLHNMHGAYWNFWTLPILSRRSPLVLTLHDEWFLTGDCAYTYDCNRWLHNCGSCPQAKEKNAEDRVCIGGADLTRMNLRLKRLATRTLDTDRVVLVSPSEWLLGQAARAPHLQRFRRVLIPYGVDREVYRPQSRLHAREALGLPKGAFLVLVTAANLFDQRKNLKLLLDAARDPGWHPKAHLILAGRLDDGLRTELATIPRCQGLGYLETREQVAQAICAADLSVVPSRADNLPYTALESQACGIPVLAAHSGGTAETVEDGATGWLMDPRATPAECASQIGRLVDLPTSKLKEVGRAASIRAARLYSTPRFVSAHRSLYEEMIDASLTAGMGRECASRS